MKKYFITASILTMISGVCALLIAGINALTAPIIANNALAKKAELCQEIFADFDASTSSVVSEGFTAEYIVEKIIANDSDSTSLGYIYTVSGSNAYGSIELLVGINADGTLESVQFITNGQSFSNETEAHVTGSYTTGITSSDVDNIDTACGATYAAKLVQAMVAAAFADSQGGSW